MLRPPLPPHMFGPLLLLLAVIGVDAGCTRGETESPNARASTSLDDTQDPVDRASDANRALDAQRDGDGWPSFSADELVGYWLIDTDATAEKMPITEAKALVPYLPEMQMGFIFHQDGALTIDGAFRGATQHIRGRYIVTPKDDAHWRLELQQENDAAENSAGSMGAQRLFDLEATDVRVITLRDVTETNPSSTNNTGKLRVVVLTKVTEAAYQDHFPATP